VSEGIAIIINKSLATGVAPDILKIAKVIPIYKSKDSQHYANYRPISLLPVISKLLGKVVHTKLYSFMYMQTIFFPVNMNSGRSTPLLMQLLSSPRMYFHHVTKENTQHVDLTKPFDTINHGTLLKYFNIMVYTV